MLHRAHVPGSLQQGRNGAPGRRSGRSLVLDPEDGSGELQSHPARPHTSLVCSTIRGFLALMEGLVQPV